MLETCINKLWFVILCAILGKTQPVLAYDVYISNVKDNTISVIDGNTLELVETVSAGECPRGIVLSHDGNYLYICPSDDDHLEVLDLLIAVVDTTTIEVEKYLLVGLRVWNLELSPDQKRLITTNGVGRDVSVIDLEKQRVVKSIRVGHLPWGIAVNP